jgi:O-antigen/teichoic acid export membrane protein
MSLKRQTLWSMLPLLTVTVVNLISVPLFYRYLGPEKYALWFYVLTFGGVFGFMDLGLGVAVGRYIGVALGRGDNKAVKEYWGTGNLIALPLLGAMALAFMAIGVGLGPRWFNVPPGGAGLLRWSFVAGGIGLFLSYYSQFWLILSQAYLEFKFLAILRTVSSLLSVLPSIFFAWLTGNPLILIAWGAAVSALQLGVFIWHGWKHYRLGWSLACARWERAREMASYTGKTFASLLVNSLLGSADRLVVGKLAPPADFSHYSICVNVGNRIQGLSAAMMGPVFSNTSRALGAGGREAVAAVYNETFAFAFPWFLLASLWAALWHPALLRIWLGEGLGAAVAPLFTPIVAGCCLTAVANISGAQLGSLNRVGTALLFTIAAGLLLVAGVYFGWQWGGLIGIAWGFFFSRAALVAQDLYVIRLISAGGWLSAKTWRHVSCQCAVALLFAGCIFIAPRESSRQLIPAVLHGTLVAGWLLRAPIKSRFARFRTPLPANVS